MSNVVVEVMSKEHCPLCDDVLIDLKLLRDELAFDVNVIDIYQDEELLEKYLITVMIREFRKTLGKSSICQTFK